MAQRCESGHHRWLEIAGLRGVVWATVQHETGGGSEDQRAVDWENWDRICRQHVSVSVSVLRSPKTQLLTFGQLIENFFALLSFSAKWENWIRGRIANSYAYRGQADGCDWWMSGCETVETGGDSGRRKSTCRPQSAQPPQEHRL